MVSCRWITLLFFFTLPVFSQVTYVLSPVAHQQFFDRNGHPLGGGLLRTYAAGTTTPQSTFADNTGTANPNPLTLDSSGFTPNGLWLDASKSYKFVLSDSNNVPQWTVDNVSGAVNSATTIPWSAPPAIGNVTPNTIDGSIITAHTRFVGPLFGNVTGNVNGNVNGNLTGNVTGNVSGSAASVPISGLTSATSSPTPLTNGNYGQYWQWSLTGGSPEAGLGIAESSPSTNNAVLSALLSSTTLSGSTVPPFQALSAGANGLRVTSSGNIAAVGSATFVGPLTGNVTGTATNATNLTGFQAVAFGATCTTGTLATSTCTSTYTIPTAYADTAYKVVCSLTGTVTGFPTLLTVTKSSASSITITIANGGSASGAVASSAGGTDCMFFHS